MTMMMTQYLLMQNPAPSDWRKHPLGLVAVFLWSKGEVAVGGPEYVTGVQIPEIPPHTIYWQKVNGDNEE